MLDMNKRVMNLFTRAFYLPYRLAFDLVSIASRFLNAIFFCGSTAQTLSARAYIDGEDSLFWRRMGRLINALFFWQDNHIKDAWEMEVERARYVLRRIEAD